MLWRLTTFPVRIITPQINWTISINRSTMGFASRDVYDFYYYKTVKTYFCFEKMLRSFVQRKKIKIDSQLHLHECQNVQDHKFLHLHLWSMQRKTQIHKQLIKLQWDSLESGWEQMHQKIQDQADHNCYIHMNKVCHPSTRRMYDTRRMRLI